jgi:hypothetical protein
MEKSESIEAIKSPEMNPIIAAGKNMGEMVANRLSSAIKVGMAVAKSSYHIREVPIEYDMRPPWKYRIHNFANTEAPS